MRRKSDSVTSILLNLEVGEQASFPILRLKSVRTQASELGAMYGRVYTTMTDRVNQLIVVERLS
jgi:hypothetical protein